MEEHKTAVRETVEMKTMLQEKQEGYIRREQEYRHVISDIGEKIKDNSTFPLVIVEEKNDDQYLLEGIDVKDDA